MKMNKMKILVVISNYNEEGSIERCINDFKKNSTIEADLIVIDNASTDHSVELIAQNNVECVVHPVNTGGSEGVIKTALLYAFMQGYDIYCHLDGDGQHNACDLAKLIKPIIDKKADIVIGSRFLNKEGFQSLFIRRLGITFFSALISSISRRSITDLTSGFRSYNKKTISYFVQQYKHEFEPCVQMLLIAHYAGLMVKEVPTVMKPRITGRSGIGLKKALKFSIFGIILVVGTILQKNNIKRISCR